MQYLERYTNTLPVIGFKSSLCYIILFKSYLIPNLINKTNRLYKTKHVKSTTPKSTKCVSSEKDSPSYYSLQHRRKNHGLRAKKLAFLLFV